MSAPVLLNLLLELRKRDRMRAYAEYYTAFHVFNQFNYTGAQMLDSIYLNLTLENFEIAFSIFCHIYVMWRLHGLTLCLLMNSSFWFDTINLG